MTLERQVYPDQGLVGVNLTACPATDCDHEFDDHEPRWKHFLDDHSSQDFGLSPDLGPESGTERGGPV